MNFIIQNINAFLLLILISIALAIVCWFTFSEKPVVCYNLGTQSSGALVISVDIENAIDDEIILVGVDYERAISIVDSLNAELKRHPRL